jgi:threonine/homoserine/homoserine lactone efflux protein
MELQFILALLAIGANYLEQLKNKGAKAAGNVIDLVDQATLAVLQENAKIKGAIIDWADPTAVQAFLATLPPFVPIAAPAPPVQSPSKK